MPSDLQDEVPVSPFVEELTGRQTPDGQTAEDERSGTEAESLVSLVAVHANHFDASGLFERLLRYDQVGVHAQLEPEYSIGPLHENVLAGSVCTGKWLLEPANGKARWPNSENIHPPRASLE